MTSKDSTIAVDQNAIRRAKKAKQRANATSRKFHQESFLEGLARDRREAREASSHARHDALMKRINVLIEAENLTGTDEVSTRLMTATAKAFLDAFDHAKPAEYVGSSRSRHASLSAEMSVWVEFGDVALTYEALVSYALKYCRKAVVVASKEN